MTLSKDPNFSPETHTEARLSPEDQRILDALVDSGFKPDQMEAVLGPMTALDHRRAQSITGLLGLMKSYPVEDSDETLLHATLAGINRYEHAQAERLSFKSHIENATNTASGRRIQLPNFLTVAAVLLIGISIFWPVMRQVRQQSMDLACANNLRMMGYGFGNYAADNDGALPVATAGLLGGNWSSRSSTLAANALVEGGYCEEGHLNCPGHHHDEIYADHASSYGSPSYSMRWVQPGQPVIWTTGMGQRITIVVGDLNPVIDALRAGNQISPLSVSLNHAGRGQNVLSSDGATLWLEAPVIAGDDNIWLPFDAEQSATRANGGVNVFLTH